MRTLLVTGSDTGVGKTHAVAALARLLAADGARVQIVKVVETGRACLDSGVGRPLRGSRGSAGTPRPTGETEEIKSSGGLGDAEKARALSGADVTAVTLATFAAALAPAAAARAEGAKISFAELLERVRALPACDWRILEGAGGIATPIDDEGRDWADFAEAVGAEGTVVVVADRLGAINQARLAHARAVQCGLNAGVWLNETAGAADAAVAASNREGLAAAGVPVWGEQRFGATQAESPEKMRAILEGGPTSVVGRVILNAPENAAPERRLKDKPPYLETDDALASRVHQALSERERQGLRRTLRVSAPGDGVLNLADNDYLALARDPALASAVAVAAAEHGTSASASPLITGWRAPHETLVKELCAWHGFPTGLLWSSGYAANAAVLGLLPARGDLVLADRLIHHSMIAGLLRSGARLRRYEHLNLDHLEEMLAQAAPTSGRTVFVVTESVFSMDGGFPDFVRLAEMKRRYGFRLIVDEAHALGWYGPEGAGLVRAAGVEAAVDVMVGTLGKTLASGGAYTLFRDAAVRDYLVNLAGEFVFSTGLSPLCAAAASAALARVRTLAARQPEWREQSRRFRARLRAEGWEAPESDSPVVPVLIGSAEAAVGAAAALREKGILAAAVRPPTVPAGTSRLRFSLKQTFDETAASRVIAALNAWRAAP